MDRMSFEAALALARKRIPTDRIGHWYWRGLTRIGDSDKVRVTFRREPYEGVVDTKTVVLEQVTLAGTGDFAEEQETPLFEQHPDPPPNASGYEIGNSITHEGSVLECCLDENGEKTWGYCGEAEPFDHEQDVRPADERPVVPNYAEEE